MADFTAMNNELHYLSLPNAPIADADVLILPVPHERTVTFKTGPGSGGDSCRNRPTGILRRRHGLVSHGTDDRLGAAPIFSRQLRDVGIRSLHATEAAVIEADDMVTSYLDRKLRQPEQWRELLKQLSTLKGPLWLTIDMDGFDPALVAGVGNPQPGGLSWHQGLDVIEHLMRNDAAELRGVDIVELIPEASRVSEMIAAKLVQKCISYWGKAQGFAQQPLRGSQLAVEDE